MPRSQCAASRKHLQHRRGAAAVEFAIIAPLLFVIFIGLMEFSRAMTVLGVLANAARAGVRAGAVTPGTYSNVVSRANSGLTAAGLDSSAASLVVQANGVTVTDDSSFAAHATPGAAISVQISISYSSISWLPASRFLTGKTLRETAVMQKEG